MTRSLYNLGPIIFKERYHLVPDWGKCLRPPSWDSVASSTACCLQLRWPNRGGGLGNLPKTVAGRWMWEKGMVSRGELKMASREDKGQKGMTQSLHFFWRNISFITLITMPGSYLALHFTSSQVLCKQRWSHLSSSPFCASASHCTAHGFGHGPTSHLISLRVVLRTSARSKTSVYPLGFKSQKVPNLNLPVSSPRHKISVLLSWRQTAEYWSLHFGLKNKKHLPETNSDELDCPPLETVQLLIIWRSTEGRHKKRKHFLPLLCHDLAFLAVWELLGNVKPEAFFLQF